MTADELLEFAKERDAEAERVIAALRRGRNFAPDKEVEGWTALIMAKVEAGTARALAASNPGAQP